jgi:hypothetical protein
MTLLALLIAALAQQGAQPTNNSQDRTVGVTQPTPKEAKPETSASSNSTDKAQPPSTEHNTDLQGSSHAKHAKKAKKATKATKSKKPQARSKKAMPEPSPAPSAEKGDKSVEREAGQGKAQQKEPKPLGEKSNQ